MRYIVYAPLFDRKSAGIVTLYELQKWLVRLGQDAIVVPFGDKYIAQPEEVAIYPEIVHGNPLKAQHVVRYLLNAPGKLKGPKNFAETDILYAFDHALGIFSEGRVIEIPIVEDFFCDYREKRTLDAFWVGKGPYTEHPITKNCIEITYTWPAHRRELALLFNKVRTFYSYDDRTMLTTESTLCGCIAKHIKNNRVVDPPWEGPPQVDACRSQVEALIEHLSTIVSDSLNQYAHNINTAVAEFLTPAHNQNQQASNRVSIVIVTCNPGNALKRCVDSIVSTTEYDFEIIFIDNGSYDGTQQYLEDLIAEHNNFQLIKNKKNAGVAVGYNQGFTKTTGDYILMLDDHTLVPKGWLESLMATLTRHAKIGMVGPAANVVRDRQVLQEVPYQDEEGFTEFAEVLAENNINSITPKRRIDPSAVLMKRAVYQEIAKLDDQFDQVNYVVDDLCLRVQNAGYVVMEHQGVCIHHLADHTFKADVLSSYAPDDNFRKFMDKWSAIDIDELLGIKNPLNEIYCLRCQEGMDYLTSGEFEKGYQLFTQLIEKHPVFEEALVGFSMAAKETQRFDESFSTISHILKINPYNAHAYNLSGLLAAEIGDLDKAKKYFKKAYEIDKSFISSRRNHAEILSIHDNVSESTTVLLDILQDFPEDIESLLLLAQLKIKTEHFNDAVILARTVLKIDPDQELAAEIIATIEK